MITQIHFQAPSSQGFRAFALPNGIPLGVSQVHDFTDVKPFPRLANKPAVFTWVVGRTTKYPVSYKRWYKKGRKSPREQASLSEVRGLLAAQDFLASPIPPDQRWSILPPEQVELGPKLRGGSFDWVGRKGITTDLNGAFFVELLGPSKSAGLVRIRTTPASGKKAVPLIDDEVDADLVYPLLKSGEQIRRFSYSPADLVAIVPNKAITSIPPVESFVRENPATYKYFARINRVKDAEGAPLLESRSTWKTRMAPTGAPIYAIYNVGPYTFAPYKVAWAEMAGSIAAAVVSMQALPYGIGSKPVIPDHKVYFVACEEEDRAHFLCAMLNSEPVRIFVDSFTLKIQVGTLFRSLRIPPYDSRSKAHARLVALSKKAHSSGITVRIQRAIDDAAWKLVGRM